jgi:hypothetical protein
MRSNGKTEKQQKLKKQKTPLVPESEDFLAIDKFSLDKEWVEQPKTYMTYARKLARATKRAVEAKAGIKLAYAQCGEKIRDDPEAYGLRKATEPAIEEKIYTMRQYQDAVAAHAQAEYNLSLLRGTCDALHQKKDALENLVVLHGRNYYAEPIAPEEVREEVETRRKRSIRSRGREE